MDASTQPSSPVGNAPGGEKKIFSYFSLLQINPQGNPCCLLQSLKCEGNHEVFSVVFAIRTQLKVITIMVIVEVEIVLMERTDGE